MSSSLPPPANAHVLDANGQLSQAWSEYIRTLGSGSEQAITAQRLAQAAQTAAGTATTAANSATTQVAALLASPPIWGIGDFRASAKTTLDPTIWLECDGSRVSVTTYADLFALLSASMGGSLGGTFELPTIPPLYSAINPAPDGTPFLRWYVRAL